MGFQFESYWWSYPQLYRIRVNQPNCVITGFTVKLDQYGRAFSCDLRYNDNSPSGFRGNPTGKPGGLVPQGDQFSLFPSNNGDGTYTFLSTAPSGVALPSQDVYWLSLSMGGPGGSNMGVGWNSALPYDDVTLEAMFIYYNSNFEQLNGRSPLIKILGCADQRTPSPSLTPSPSRVSNTPSAPPTPSLSASPLACGVKELTNTMSLSQFGWFSYYPQMHRLYVNRPVCLLTAFTIKLQSYATLVLAELRDDTAGNNGADVKPGALVPQGDQFSAVPVNNGDGTYTFYTTARPGLYLNSQDYYWLVLSFSMNWDGYDGVVMGWSGTTANTNITVDWIFYTLQPGTIQGLSQRTAMLKLLGCCDLAPSVSPSPSPSQVSSTPTPSFTPSASPTTSPSPTVSFTASITPSPSPSPSPTASFTPSITPTSSNTPSPSNTPSSSVSSSPSGSASSSFTSRSATPSISISTTPTQSMSNTPAPSISTTPSPSPSVSRTPSASPFALPVAIASGGIYTNGQADVEVVTMSTAQTTTTTQCAGNIVVGLSGTGIKFSYFIRLTGAAAAAGTTTMTMAYVVDMSTGATLGQMDVTALMPTAVNDSYTQVTAEVTPSSRLVVSLSYWLPFCFTTTVTTRSLVGRENDGSIGIGGVSSSGGMTTVGVCSGGPSCTPTVQEGSLATVISRTAKSDSGGDSGTIVAIAAGVAVPVALLVAGVVACVVVYIAYTRARGRLSQLPPTRRRSSVRHAELEREVQRLHENEMFQMGDLTKEQRRKLHRESWTTS